MLLSGAVYTAESQSITLSQSFAGNGNYIIGKYKDEILIYNLAFITKYQLLDIYDTKMNLLRQISLPLPAKSFGFTFLKCDDFFYIFYQHQSGRTVSLYALKVGMDGKQTGPPKELDKTPELDFWRQNKIYSVAVSENKKYLTAFKIDNTYGPTTTITTLLFNDSLKLLHRSVLDAPIVDGVEFFSEFNVDNDGNFLFVKNCELDNIADVAKSTGLAVKSALSDSIYFMHLLPNDINANDIRLKIDNLNGHYIITALYTSDAQRNIDGLYCLVLDKLTHEPLYARKTIFNEGLRKESGQEGPLKTAFNYLELQNIHLRKDGGFVVDAGFFYTTPRTNENVRWRKFFYETDKLACGYLDVNENPHNVYDPWRNIPNRPWGMSAVCNNITAFSFDSSANPEWIKILPAAQIGDPGGMGYLSFKIGNQLYYIHNETVKGTIFLTAQTVNREGEVSGDLLFKDLDRTLEYKEEFYPRESLQVDDKEVIMPLRKGNYICFAKIDF